MGEESTEAQIAVTQVLFLKAAEGQWTLHVLGEDAVYTSLPGDTTIDIRNGLKAAVDALALPVTTSNVTVAPNLPGFTVTAVDPGVALIVNTLDPGDVPAPGQIQITVIDDALRTTHYNWGLWTVRVIFRDTPPAGPGDVDRNLAGTLASRFRNWLQAGGTLPVTAGLAYPTQWDALQDPPGARIAWRNTIGPFNLPEQEGGVWSRGVALDVVFEVVTGMAFDVPIIVEFEQGSLSLS
jgi:hypothetical protein